MGRNGAREGKLGRIARPVQTGSGWANMPAAGLHAAAKAVGKSPVLVSV